MSKLKQLEAANASKSTAREKINAWLDRIGETDSSCRAEVIGLCENGGEVIHKDGTVEKLSAKSYRDFYLSMAAA